MSHKDLTGQRFGRLIVIEEAGRTKQGNVKWLCRCDCGQDTVASQGNLHRSTTKSCGCFRAESASRLFTTHGLSKENGKQSRLYGIWLEMKRRCCDQRRKAFKNYGGRGISVHPLWMAFGNFYSWAMANGYAPNLTIERKDNNGNYEPGNCTWIPLKLQSSNTRSSRFITHEGRTLTMTQWAAIVGLSTGTLWMRLKLGWPYGKALTTPIRRTA